MRGKDPPRRGLPVRPIAPGGLPPPDAQTAQYQNRAHQAGFGKEVQRKIVRRSPDFSNPRERGIESRLKRGAADLPHPHPPTGTPPTPPPCNPPLPHTA